MQEALIGPLIQNYCRDFEQSSPAAWLYLLLFSMPPTVATVNLPLNLYWLHISEQLCHCSLVYTITYLISTSEACQLFITCAWSSRQVLNYTGLAPTPSPSPGGACMHVGQAWDEFCQYNYSIMHRWLHVSTTPQINPNPTNHTAALKRTLVLHVAI